MCDFDLRTYPRVCSAYRKGWTSILFVSDSRLENDRAMLQHTRFNYLNLIINHLWNNRTSEKPYRASSIRTEKCLPLSLIGIYLTGKRYRVYNVIPFYRIGGADSFHCAHKQRRSSPPTNTH